MHEMNSVLNQEFDPSNEDFIDQMLLSMPQTWPKFTEDSGASSGSGDGNNCRELDYSVQALYNVLAGTMQPNGTASNQAQHLHIPQAGIMQTQSCFGGGGGGEKPRQRVRAKRGQATDPHSIAERLRRERIAERMKSLQELVPNANKTDKASMLEEIIEYVKFLQLQVKVLSMSRMGGTGVVAPLADVASQMSKLALHKKKQHNQNSLNEPNKAAFIHNTNFTKKKRISDTGVVRTERSTNNDNVTVTESRVVKLMEEDMGLAMQYLQGKGLCLLPISLATAISTATPENMNSVDE